MGASIFGGERGIRTLETLLTFTRVPVVRLRPAQPSLHDFYIISKRRGKSKWIFKFVEFYIGFWYNWCI